MKKEYQLAKLTDLDNLILEYKSVMDQDDFQNGDYWYDDYPFKELKHDIEKGEMYVLRGKDEIISSFVLSKECEFHEHVDWHEKDGAYLYIHRLVTNAKYLRQGYGHMAFDAAFEICKQKGIKYLRLVVVDSNKVAFEFYERVGFKVKDRELKDEKTLNNSKVVALEYIVF